MASARQGGMKRKRVPVKENLPIKEKKPRCEEEITSPNTSDERLPLSELSRIDINETVESRVFSVFTRCKKACPIPSTQNIDGNLLWKFYMRKDSECSEARSSYLFTSNPSIQPRMRSVLLEWLIEVCDVYKLHRETYFLAVDYLDRYLSVSEKISKNQLQLIGVTCLLIASKFEEIYPPKLSEFAYITDGSCSEEDILHTEILIVKAIDWKCTTITPDRWLSIFLQLLYIKEGDVTVLTKFSTKLYDTIARLLDLCSLDEGFLRFSYRILAATAFNLVCSKPSALVGWGMRSSDIKESSEWMRPFWHVLKEKCGVEPASLNLKALPPGPKPADYKHTLMKRNVSLDLLSSAQELAEVETTPGLLTPPSSSKSTGKPATPSTRD